MTFPRLGRRFDPGIPLMRKASLCVIIKEGKILLAMKKRGFGAGKWNGPGGKLDYMKGDKTISDTAIRETKEEIGIEPENMQALGVLSFCFPHNKEWDQDVSVYLVEEWKGELKESEEMIPRWFDIEDIPFADMWDDDKYWLKDVLKGKKIKKASFVFAEDGRVKEHNIELENIKIEDLEKKIHHLMDCL